MELKTINYLEIHNKYRTSRKNCVQLLIWMHELTWTKANFPLEEVFNCLLALGTLGRKLVCLEYLVNLRVWNKNYLVSTKMIFHNLFVTGSLHALFNRLEKHKVNLIQAGVQFHFAFSSKLHFYKLLVDLWYRFPEIWMLQLNKQQGCKTTLVSCLNCPKLALQVT